MTSEHEEILNIVRQSKVDRACDLIVTFVWRFYHHISKIVHEVAVVAS